MIHSLETARLVLRPLRLEDAAATQRLFPHWEIVKFLNKRVPWPYPEDGALQFYKTAILPAIERGENWTWMLWLKDGPAHHIGSVSLMASRDENRGFWLALPWHKQGLMGEACQAVTAYWFETLGQERLRVAKALANPASRRISEREGAKIIGIEERDYVSGRWPTEIWDLTRTDWRANRKHGQESRFGLAPSSGVKPTP